MPKINITDECRLAIRNAAQGNAFRQTGSQRENGTWDIPIDDDVLERLEKHQMEGESLSDVIMRVIGTQRGMN